MTQFSPDFSPRLRAINESDDPWGGGGGGGKDNATLRVQLIETLYPCGRAMARVVEVMTVDGEEDPDFRTQGSIEVGEEVEIYDPLCINFGCPGEWFTVQYDADLLDYVCIGSKGLLRRAFAAEDKLVSDGTGLFNIGRFKDDGSLSSSVPVTVHFDFYNEFTPQRFLDGEEYWIVYIHDSWADPPDESDPDDDWQFATETGRWELMPSGDAWLREGIVTEPLGITAGGNGEVTVYTNGVVEQVNGADYKVTGWLDWIHGGEDVSFNTRVFIGRFSIDGRWRIIAADCEQAPQAAPPGHGDALVAEPSGTQGDVPLGWDINRVRACASDYDVVTLPDAFLGMAPIFIKNETDKILRVYPDTDNRINRTVNNWPDDVPPRASRLYHCVRANRFVTDVPWDNAARLFDGVDDDVDIASSDVPDNLTANSFTLAFEVLVAPTTNSLNKFMIQHGDGSNKLKIGQTSSNLFVVGTTGGGVYPGNQATQTGLYVIQHDTAQTGFARWKAWLDGVSLDTSNTTGSHTDIFEQDDAIRIGRRLSGIYPTDCVLRDFRIWSELVSPDDVLDDYDTNLEIWLPLNDAHDATAAADWSGNNRNGTYNETERYLPTFSEIGIPTNTQVAPL